MAARSLKHLPHAFSRQLLREWQCRHILHANTPVLILACGQWVAASIMLLAALTWQLRPTALLQLCCLLCDCCGCLLTF
jgi:hypothetical protein